MLDSATLTYTSWRLPKQLSLSMKGNQLMNDTKTNITDIKDAPINNDGAEAAKDADTIFMANHGVCAVGVNMKQAFWRCLIVEDGAKSLVAATIVGKPQLLTPQQEKDLMALSGPQHRVKMMEVE